MTKIYSIIAIEHDGFNMETARHTLARSISAEEAWLLLPHLIKLYEDIPSFELHTVLTTEIKTAHK